MQIMIIIFLEPYLQQGQGLPGSKMSNQKIVIPFHPLPKMIVSDFFQNILEPWLGSSENPACQTQWGRLPFSPSCDWQETSSACCTSVFRLIISIISIHFLVRNVRKEYKQNSCQKMTDHRICQLCFNSLPFYSLVLESNE